MLNRLFGLIFGLFFSISVGHAEIQTDPELAHILDKAGVVGTLVLIDVSADRILVSDEIRSRERLLPASTFKIVNALIGLQTGVVQEEEIFPWDGTPLPIKTWEKEMTIKEAMAVSSVPVFQTIARRIGRQRMAEWVGKIGYGNNDIGTVVDRFWLDGPLVISPVEEAQFMARLAQGQLPFAEQTLSQLRQIIPQEKIGNALLFGKTGWATAAKPKTGWYVGWVENQKTIMTFAVTIEMNSLEEGPLRKTLATEALQYSGVL